MQVASFCSFCKLLFMRYCVCGRVCAHCSSRVGVSSCQNNNWYINATLFRTFPDNKSIFKWIVSFCNGVSVTFTQALMLLLVHVLHHFFDGRLFKGNTTTSQLLQQQHHKMTFNMCHVCFVYSLWEIGNWERE